MSPIPAPTPARRSRLLLASVLGLATLAISFFAACPSPTPCDVACGEGCCAANETCAEDLTCQCAPSCDGKACGEDDGCGNACNDTCPGADAGPGKDAGRADAGDPGDTGPKVDAGPVGASVTFKVMDWNVHDFFDETDDPNHTDTVMSAAQVSSKITKSARTESMP